MIYKKRCESEELLVLRQLNTRMSLSEKDKQYYYNVEKGFAGEIAFDQLVDQQRSNCLILNDLLFEINNSFFQLDKVLIAPEKTYLYEVKNFEGDYYLENNNWFTHTKTEIKNPLLQLDRSVSSLRRLFKQNGYYSSLDGRLIFINPEFHLYNAPLDQPITYPPQLNRYIHEIKSFDCTAKLTTKHYKVAEKLLKLDIKKNPYSLLPSYKQDDIKKGIYCPTCGSFYTRITDQHLLSCDTCYFKEILENGVLRSISELRLLFPEEKITTNSVLDWCEIVNSKRLVQQILAKNFKQKGWGKTTYYIK